MGSATSLINSAPSLSTKRQHGRAVNSVADYLRSNLRVPNVYLEPTAMLLKSVDVLAVDAAGSGDIHAAEVKVFPAPPTIAQLRQYIAQVKAIPAHFKYIAFMPGHAADRALETESLFAADGIGRVGLLYIGQHGDSFPTVQLVVKPERFRMQATDLARVERYLNNSKPDIFVRV